MTQITSKKRQKTPLKRLISIIAIAIMLFALALPCFAYSPPLLIDGSGNIAVDTTRSFAFVNENNRIVAYGYKFRAPTFFEYDGYNVYVDFSIVNVSLGSLDYSDYTFIPLGSNVTQSQAENVVNSYLSGALSGAYGLTLEDAFDNGYQEGYYTGHADGEMSQYAYQNGYADGYRQGETDGLDTSETGKNLILTIFSVPSYVLSNVFNFEIFGINLYSLKCFLLTISIIGFVLKKIL